MLQIRSDDAKKVEVCCKIWQGLCLVSGKASSWTMKRPRVRIDSRGWYTPGSAARCGRDHPQRGRTGEAEASTGTVNSVEDVEMEGLMIVLCVTILL